MREKLIDNVHSELMGLLQRTPYIRCEDVNRQYAVNWLMNNGVTVQKWIPASEPPKENGYYLCVVCVSSVNQRKEYRRMILFWEDNVWIDMANCFRTKKPLYWMPLPSTEGLE
jgi:hypothetical protein